MSSAPPEPSLAPRSWRHTSSWVVPLGSGVVVGIAMRLIYSDWVDRLYNPMGGSFLLVPMLVAAVAVYVAERTKRRSWRYHLAIGAGANALFALGTMLTKLEGLICVIFAVPLFAILGGIAGLIMGAVCRWTNWPRRALYGFAALPLLLGGLEQYLPLPQETRSVERVRIVNAAPDRVWPHLVMARNIRPEEMDDAWMYRIGVPLPSSAVTRLDDGTFVRHITMGKGIHFDQVAADWEPNRRVRWLYRFSSDSFPPAALDDHVRIGGRYFDLIDTEYSLRQVSAGTELRVRMTYRVSTAFNWYTQPIARLLVGNFEETALRFYAHRAETN